MQPNLFPTALLLVAALALGACSTGAGGVSTTNNGTPGGGAAGDDGVGGIANAGGEALGGESTGGADDAGGSRNTAGGAGASGGTFTGGVAGTGGVAPGGSGPVAGSAAGGVGPGPDVDDPSPDFDGTLVEYRETVQEEALNLRAECLNGDPLYVSSNGKTIDRETYIALSAEENVRSLLPSEEAGRLEFDLDAAGACVAHLEALSCEDFLREYALGTFCGNEVPVIGKVARGGYCTAREECADPSDHCALNRNACPATWCAPSALENESCVTLPCGPGLECVLVGAQEGHCEPTQRVGEGEDCLVSTSCEPGLVCAGTCQEYEAALPCVENGDCPWGQVCSLVTEAAVGTCGIPQLLGEPCTNQSPSEHDCAEGLDCAAGDGGEGETCVAARAELGESCRNTGSDHAIGCIESRCDVLDQETQEGTCVPFDEQGEPCSQTSCAAGLDCTAEDGCQPVVPTCQVNTCEVGSHCDVIDGCVPNTAVGGECVDDDICGLGAACINGTCATCE